MNRQCTPRETDIEHQISSTYHPQMDGRDERMNQMTKAIVKYLNPEHNDWDVHIHDNKF